MSGWTPIGLRRRAAFLYLVVVTVLMVEIMVEIMIEIMVIMVEIMVDIMGIMVVIDKNDYLVGVLMVMAVIIMIRKVMTVFYMMLELMTLITVSVTSIVHRSMCGWVKHPGELPV